MVKTCLKSVVIRDGHFCSSWSPIVMVSPWLVYIIDETTEPTLGSILAFREDAVGMRSARDVAARSMVGHVAILRGTGEPSAIQPYRQLCAHAVEKQARLFWEGKLDRHAAGTESAWMGSVMLDWFHPTHVVAVTPSDSSMCLEPKVAKRLLRDNNMIEAAERYLPAEEERV